MYVSLIPTLHPLMRCTDSLRVAQAGYGEDSEGRSVLILAPYEEPFLALPEIAALPLKKIAPTRNAVLAQWRKRAHAGMEAVGRRVKMDAYKVHIAVP